MKTVCILLILIVALFSFTACDEYVMEEPVITVNGDGYLVVNGALTEHRIHVTDEVGVSGDGYLTVNGVKTEYRVWDESEDNGSENRYIHLSFDDVSLCFRNLSSKNCTSLFDEPFFARLKQLHDEYGARFSLYTYNSVLNTAPSTFKNEFADNSDWLKLGFHSDSEGLSLANATYEEGLAYWNAFVENVERVCGTTDCLDRMPRLE